MLWSPLMDRFVDPPWLGRRRGLDRHLPRWSLFGAHAGYWPVSGTSRRTVGHHRRSALAIAFASASQDIVIDAYAVDVLRKDEQGDRGRSTRIAVYRAAMFRGRRTGHHGGEF